ncbi:porin [Cupriavidus oxalaticus]|uniref:porin n=1 Tax=Cupriavidus oxalaticus TaxID=96344 RepID=UPI0031710D2A
MKTRIYAAMLLSAAAPLAAAQSSVTLYGVADIGLEYLSHANAAGDKLFRMTSGNVSGSRWGLRGVEDLGSGMKAVYALESGFDLDNGVSSQGGRLFGRQAFVGLDHKWGRLTLGRQQNALFDLLINYEPMVLAARYSSLAIDPVLTGRYDNTAKYTGKFGPVTATALYSFARGTSITSGGTTTLGTEVPGDVKSDRAFGGGLEYAGGNFGATVIYDQQQGTRGITGQNSGQTDRRIAAAANFSFGSSTVLAGYRWFNGDIGVAPGSPQRRNDLFWLGYRFQATPALTLTGAGYYLNNKRNGQDPWMLVASANYALSKRTDAFLNVGYVRNKDNSNLGLNGFGSTITPGENQTGVMVNIRHKF